MKPTRPPFSPEEAQRRIREAVENGRITYAEQNHIHANPDILAEFMRTIFDMEPGGYALSDESVITDMRDIGQEPEELFEQVRVTYGISITRDEQPYLWEVIEQIAQQRRVKA